MTCTTPENRLKRYCNYLLEFSSDKQYIHVDQKLYNQYFLLTFEKKNVL